MLSGWWLLAIVPASVIIGFCIMALLVAASDDAFKGGM
jgi:hypothetical protein